MLTNIILNQQRQMQRGYLIVIVGGSLLTLGIIISIIWAGSWGGRIIHQNTILNSVHIYPSGTASAITQVNDVGRPLSLVISIEPNTDQTNPTLRETVRNPNGEAVSTNVFTKQLLTAIKPDVIGKYTLTIYNLGGSPISVGILFGNLPFVGQNNQLNLNLFGGLLTGGILVIAGIFTLLAGLIVLIADRRRITRNKTPSI